jgi:hypothetical protein
MKPQLTVEPTASLVDAFPLALARHQEESLLPTRFDVSALERPRPILVPKQRQIHRAIGEAPPFLGGQLFNRFLNFSQHAHD